MTNLNRAPLFRLSLAKATGWLAVGVLLANLFLCGLVGFTIYRSESQYRRQALLTVENLSQVIERYLAGLVDKANFALLSVTDEYVRESKGNGPASIGPSSLETFLQQRHFQNPDLGDLRVADRQGRVSIAVGATARETTSIADRPYFTHLRDSPNSGLVIFGPVVGRITGKWVLVLARRLEDAHGDFAGVVYTAIDVASVSQTLASIDLGDLGSVTVYKYDLSHDDSGTIVARHAKGIRPDDSIGSTAMSAELRSLLHAGRTSATYHARSGLDHVLRTFYYRWVPDQPLIVVVGLADHDFLSEWRREAMILIALAIAFGLVTITATWALNRWWKRREADTALASGVFHTTQEGIMITDADGQILSVNPAFSQITGYSADEAIGNDTRLLASKRHDRAFFAAMWRQLLEGGRWQGEIWNRRKNGEVYLNLLNITALHGTSGEVQKFVAVFSDVTELRQKDDQLKRMAYQDSLTGLPNRLLLADRLGQSIEQAKRGHTKVALLFIDLDNFKVVNDSLGHNVGDTLLRLVAERLQSSLRKGDTIARAGGDEFVVICPEVHGGAEVAEVAEKLIAQLAVPFRLGHTPVRVGASIGLALFPGDGEDLTTLMMAADTAMYRAKADGRNSFRFFDASMMSAAVERLQLESALRRALASGEFELHYQPKIDLRTGLVLGSEALIRWNSKDRGLISPTAFIPAAEEMGLIGEIGDWVLAEACRQLRDWKNQGLPPLSVAVNVSARQFLQNTFADLVEAHLAKHALDPSLLEIELTESTVMTQPDRVIDQLLRLRSIGLSVAIDDFGTGYSSLSYLKKLPLKTIKIDRSFVHDVDSDADNQAIVSAILGLAGSLGMSVVAEGVETEGEERCLKAAGCAMAQGYRYAKPLPAADFVTWLADRNAVVPPPISTWPPAGGGL